MVHVLNNFHILKMVLVPVFNDFCILKLDNLKEEPIVLGFQEYWDKCEDNIFTPQMKVLLMKLKDKTRILILKNDDL